MEKANEIFADRQTRNSKIKKIKDRQKDIDEMLMMIIIVLMIKKIDRLFFYIIKRF